MGMRMGAMAAMDDDLDVDASELVVRRPRFPFADGLRADWNPRLPEFAYAANAVSMLMPYAEPYFCRSVRAVMDDLPEGLQPVAEDYVRQEASHHAQHRRFNDVITEGHPMMKRLERRIGGVYTWFERHSSKRLNMAFAAGSEAIAFGLARWTEGHLDELFEGADPVARDLYWWHLAEEVEHKSVAFDVYAEVDGSKLRYTFGMCLSLVLLGIFVALNTMVMLVASRRVFNPVSWFRLTKWALSMVWKVFPELAVSVLPSHHPSKLTDPIYLTTWLRAFDPETASVPSLTALD